MNMMKKTSRSSKRSSSSPARSRASYGATVDHEKIKEWVEMRGGHPAGAKGIEPTDRVAGMLRIDYSGDLGEGTLEGISWEEFFDRFEASRLALIYQEKTAEGKESRFSKFVSRDSVEPEQLEAESRMVMATQRKQGDGGEPRGEEQKKDNQSLGSSGGRIARRGSRTMGISARLEREHKEVDALFRQILGGGGRSRKPPEAGNREELFQQLKQKLEIHSAAEETVFYPSLEDEESVRDQVLQAYVEHRLIRDMIFEIERRGLDDEGFVARCRILANMVKTHVAEEEKILFAYVRRLFTAEQEQALGTIFEAEEREQRQELAVS